MIGMAIFMRGLWAVSSLSRSEIEISGMEWQEGWEGGILYLRRAKVDTSGTAYPLGTVGNWDTPSSRISQFPLARFPLTQILAYVCASGGIPR